MRLQHHLKIIWPQQFQMSTVQFMRREDYKYGYQCMTCTHADIWTPSQILAGSETKTHAVQTESDGTNTIGAHEQRIVWIQPHELESNPNILRGDETHHAKKGSYRASQGRSANLVDVGLERSGVEGRNHGGRPSVSFSKRSLRGGAGSRRRVRGSCHLVRLRRQDLEAPASRFTSDVEDPEAPPRGSPPANKSSSLSCQKHERKKSSSMRSAS
jgi:hypothetical protein